MLEGLRLALTTFTVWPASRSAPAVTDRRTARAAMLWSPVVGALLAAVGAAVLYAARRAFLGPTVWMHRLQVELFEEPLLAAALAIAALALLTRGLHLDGLADTVDGLASGRPATEALAVMRDGPIGALGAAALVLVLMVDVLALAVSVLEHHGTQAFVVSVLSGRLAILWSCTPGNRAARTTGMGALAAETVGRSTAAVWTVVVLAGAVVYGRFDTDDGSVHGAVRAGVAVLLALGTAWALRRHAIRRFGGITGDVLGALCELAALVSLLTIAAGTP